MKYLLILLMSNIGLSSLTYASKAENCFSGNDEARTLLATRSLEGIIDTSPLPADTTNLKTLPLKKADATSTLNAQQQNNITYRLAELADQLSCEFSLTGQFKTLGQTRDSMVNSFHKKDAAEDKDVEIKPGFKMAIIPSDGPNFIFLEVTEDGFVFHDCGKDDKDFTRSKVYPGSFCRTLLSEGAFIPVHQFLHDLNSGRHVRRVFFKALSQMTVVVTSSLGAGLISPIATGISSYLEQDSMARIKRDFTVHKVIQEMLHLETLALQNEVENKVRDPGAVASDSILSRLVPYSYEDLRGALVDVLTVMLADDFKQMKVMDRSPGNPSLINLPGLKIQQSVNRVYNQLYQEGKTAPAPTDK